MIVEEKITTEIELKDQKIKNNSEITENPLEFATTKIPFLVVRESGELSVIKIKKKKQKT